jgi:trk system potassium uptake protein TrkH
MIKKPTPQQQLIASFVLLILVGSLVLMLPYMTKNGRMSYIDALFTSTSAVCVTGLVVKDTGADFTRTGQWVVLALIQLGGLGIMTFSTIFLLILGKQPSLSQDTVLQDTFAHSPMKKLHTLIVSVILFTFVVEFIGAALYFLHWIHEVPVNDAMFISLFHAISAFCNAGFCLFPDSFTRYQGHMFMNLNTIFLIITGGIGFLVLLELYQRYGRNKSKNGRQRKTLSLHAKLTLLTTMILILAGAVFFFFVEYHDVLRGMNLSNRILISLFQSVTARTAGFNTVDFSLLSNSTLFFFVILMFIGASPGSCGGGIKTTTAAVFFALVRSKVRGEVHTRIMNRTIPIGAVAKAVAVVISSGLVITVLVILLLLSQLGGSSHVESRGMFLEYLFEAVSAFGTVGLSMGKTWELNAIGKLVIIVLMFVGRLGPLTLAFSIRARETAGRLKYSEEAVMIG